MSDTAVLERVEAPAEVPVGHPLDVGRAAVWAGLVVGPLLLTAAYSVAANAEHDGSQIPFLLFWAGVFAFLVPAALRLFSAAATRAERFATVAMVAVYTFIPKYLRNPSRPLFFDELANWQQTERLYTNGRLFRPSSSVRILESFPGLHALTASLRHLTGLTTWQTALVLLTVLHVAACFGIYVLARRVTESDRVAGVAALVYAVNPAFMFFNSQFAYQSLGIVLLIWALVTALEAIASATSRGRAGWGAVSIVLGIAGIVTHHISGLLLVAFLLGAAVGAQLRAGRGDVERQGARTAWVLAGILLVVALAWTFLQVGWSNLWSYLSPYPREGFDEIGGLFGSDRRQPFQNSGLPTWERLVAFLAPPLAIFGAYMGWRGRDRIGAQRSTFLGVCAVMAGLYVVALPFVLTRTGSEGAHRYFPFAYIWCSVLIALGAVIALGKVDALDRARQWRTYAVLLVAFAVLTMGNLASNVNQYYRFPGPWVSGSDTRNLTDELVAATSWFRGLHARERIVADNFNGTTFAALGSSRIGCTIAAACNKGFPLWDFYFEEGIPIELIDRLRAEDYGYLVIDRRMATATSRTGWYFDRFEPGAFEREKPVSAAALAKYERVPWATKIYSSDSYEIYRLDFDALGSGVVPPASQEVSP